MRSRELTRRAILEAMADVVNDTDGIGFSVQAVADRAGLTHRTVYNHFPTRDALCEGFADHVDELLAATPDVPASLAPSFSGITLASLPELIGPLYTTLARRDQYARALVMLMIGNRRPLQGWSGRTTALEGLVAREIGDGGPLTPRQVAAALRIFASSVGWHLLTEQCGLSTRQAAATSAWAIRTLLEAAKSGPTITEPLSAPRGPRASRQRRRSRSRS